MMLKVHVEEPYYENAIVVRQDLIEVLINPRHVVTVTKVPNNTVVIQLTNGKYIRPKESFADISQELYNVSSI